MMLYNCLIFIIVQLLQIMGALEEGQNTQVDHFVFKMVEIEQNRVMRTAVMNTTCEFPIKTRPLTIIRTLVGCFVLPSKKSLSRLCVSTLQCSKSTLVQSLKTFHPTDFQISKFL